jgi:hypothetical protein
MNENEMGNRGSKSVFFLSNTVKEQRVDGSYFESKIYSKLRYTLIETKKISLTIYLTKLEQINI